MAKVFLSYDREDLARAKAVAALLEQSNHDVWWDRDIQGGAKYTREIERALDNSDNVVVLWSKASVESEWVRDEAAEGRDNGKLVPVLIDPVKPPMGFRQFQTIDLKDWNGRGRSPSTDTLLRALKPGLQPPSSKTPHAATPSTTPRRRLIPIIAALVIAVLAAGLVWLWTPRGAGVATVTVKAADPGSLSQDAARSLMVKLGVLQGLSTNAIELVDGGSPDQKAAYRLSVGMTGDPSRTQANLALFSTDNGTVLWSKNFDAATGERADLDERIAIASARVLACVGEEALPEARAMSAKGRRAYLNACAMLAELSYDKRPVIPLLETVVADAPNFRPVWATLIMAESQSNLEQANSGDSTAVSEVRLKQHLETARKLDPEMPEIALVETDRERNDLVKVEALIVRARAADPTNPQVLQRRSQFLTLVGRLRDAIDAAARSVEADPLAPDVRG